MANLSFISYANCRKQKADISSISLYAYIIADNAITIDENYYIQRNVEKSLQAYYATKRDLSIGTAIAVQYDIKRYISNFEINNSIAKRIIDKTMTISYDVQRDLAQYISIVSDFDLKRYVYKHISLSSDTFRKQGYLTKWNFSTKVIQNGSIEIKFDTLAQALKNISWQNGQVVQPKGMRLINAAISIQENTISDNISMDLMFGSMLPKDRISGNILDYYYDFMVKTTSITDKKLSITSMTAWKILTHSLIRYPNFNKDGKIVVLIRDNSSSEPHIVMSGGNIGGSTTINFGVSGGVDDSKREPTAKASVHFKYLANMLGLEPVIMFDDFTPSNGCANQSATCIDLISNFFSWSKEIPWHQINVFIRDKKIYALQRGHEINIVDITDIPHTRPVIRQEPIMIYKTMAKLLYKNVGYDVNLDFDFEDDDNDDNGILLYFETGSADNEIIYDIYNRPAMQIINNADGSQEVIKFDYNTNARQINENHTVLKNGKKNDSYNVYHTDIGHRHAITSKSDISGVIENAIANTNNVLGLNNSPHHRIIITPSLGEYHSNYLYQLNDTYGNSKKYSSSEENDTLPFSIEDSSLNNKYFKEISEYCNQRIKETVTLDLITSVSNGISEYKHIIDFRDKIILAGCEYYLVSNNVSISPKELKQSLVLVRWK